VRQLHEAVGVVNVAVQRGGRVFGGEDDFIRQTKLLNLEAEHISFEWLPERTARTYQERCADIMGCAAQRPWPMFEKCLALCDIVVGRVQPVPKARLRFIYGDFSMGRLLGEIVRGGEASDASS
jgi:hypothetical protein